MTAHSTCAPALSATPLQLPRNPLARLWQRLEQARALSHQRRALKALDDTRLRDIGLDRTAALTEAARPCWDAPRHWRG